LLWKVEGDSISNYIVFGNYVTWISQEDQIKFADKYKGNVIWTIEIKPSMDYFDITTNKQHLGYYLCTDESLSNVFVVLGDSRQLFAVEIIEEHP